MSVFIFKANVAQKILEGLDTLTLEMIDSDGQIKEDDIKVLRVALEYYENLIRNERGYINHPSGSISDDSDSKTFEKIYKRVKSRLDLLTREYGPKAATYDKCSETVEEGNDKYDNYCVVTRGHDAKVVPHIGENGKQRLET